MTPKPIACMLIAILVAGCEKPATTAVQTADAPPRVEAEPFRGEVYRTLNGQTALTLISRDECELRNGQQTLLCKYTKQTDSLRVVVTAFGTNQVVYYRNTPQGIQDNEGMVLLAPQPYAAAVEQTRLAREHQEKMRREAEERERAEQRAKESALANRRSKYLEWFKSYFAKGQNQPGKYRVWGGSRKFYSCVLTVTEEPKISTEGDSYKFTFIGKVHWTQDKPEEVNDIVTIQDHPVMIEGTIDIPEDDITRTTLYFYWSDPKQQKYIRSGEIAQRFDSTWDPKGQNLNFIFERN